MKRSLILLTSLILVNCASRTIPPVAIPIAPPISESALKDFSKVKSGIEESILKNSKIDDKINDQLQSVIDQNQSIQDVLDQAQRINDKVIAKQSVTEQDSFNLVTEIKKVKVRNLYLETQNKESSNLIKEQSQILMITKLGADATYMKLGNKEQEANQLREQNIFLGKNLIEKNLESEKLKGQLTDEKQISASAKVYRNIIWSIAGVWMALLVVKNIWMSVNPAARLRF